jgi:hypothetical protein
MGTARDIQRSKVYGWEWATEGRRDHKLSRPQSSKYVKEMYRWHTTANIEGGPRGGGWTPDVSFNTRRSRVSGMVSYGRTKITLTDTKAIHIELWAVAHEVAHCVTPNEVCTETGGAHGRLFMRHLIELLIRFKVTSMSLAELEASAKAAGVKVAPRTHSLRTKKLPTVSEPLVLSGAF